MIPRIDVRACNARKCYTGELSFDYVAEDSLIDIPYVTFSPPVRCSLSYEIFADGSVDVKGRVCFALKGLCSRCLNETEQQFEAEVDATFAEGEGDGETTYGYRGGVVDLTELLRDTLLIAMPERLECGTDCSAPTWNDNTD